MLENAPLTAKEKVPDLPDDSEWQKRVATLVRSALFTFQTLHDRRGLRVLASRMEQNAVTPERFPKLTEEITSSLQDYLPTWWAEQKRMLNDGFTQQDAQLRQLIDHTTSDLEIFKKMGVNVEQITDELAHFITDNSPSALQPASDKSNAA